MKAEAIVTGSFDVMMAILINLLIVNLESTITQNYYLSTNAIIYSLIKWWLSDI